MLTQKFTEFGFKIVNIEEARREGLSRLVVAKPPLVANPITIREVMPKESGGGHGHGRGGGGGHAHPVFLNPSSLQ